MKLRSTAAVLVILLIVRVYGGITVIGSLTHEKVCHPGQTYEGQIIILNSGDQEEEVRLYQTDYRFFCDGTTNYDAPGQSPRSNSEWLEFSPSRFRIPPNEQTTVRYRITVPESQALIGTYWSVLMVEPVPAAIPASMTGKSVGIATLMRYGVQMISHIGYTGNRQIQFINTQLVRQDSLRLLQVDIENIGTKLARPLVWVELFSSDGISMGAVEGAAFRVYPGTSVRHHIELPAIEAGEYKALIVADCGDDDLFGINYSIKIRQ